MNRQDVSTAIRAIVEGREPTHRRLTAEEYAELVRVVVHECGHAVVAGAFGFRAAVEINRYVGDPGDVDEDAPLKFWDGRCVYRTDAQPTRSDRRLFSLGGGLAVLLLEDPRITPRRAFERARADALHGTERILSESDARGAGDFTLRHVTRVLGILRADWDQLDANAERLVTMALEQAQASA